jgi:hypothetical protein
MAPRRRSPHDHSPWETLVVPMRENCRHFESRTYDDGEVARLCVLGLAPEQPWRCPEGCPHFELSVIDGTFVTDPLRRPPVEAEPDAAPDDVEGVLADAEAIVEDSEPDVIREVEGSGSPRRRWWQRAKRRPPDDDGFRLSNR